MVNIFTKKSSKLKSVPADETHSNEPSTTTSSAIRRANLAGKASKEIDELPQLRDYPAVKQSAALLLNISFMIFCRRDMLFEQKLDLCSHVFNFEHVRPIIRYID